MQMVCRDRNRIAAQSDILGAAALGISNLLCLSGDHQVFGDHPQAKNVFDVDSIQLLKIAKQMRDDVEIFRRQRCRRAAGDVHRGSRQSFCRSFQNPGSPPGQEGRGGSAIYPDPVHF